MQLALLTYVFVGFTGTREVDLPVFKALLMQAAQYDTLCIIYAPSVKEFKVDDKRHSLRKSSRCDVIRYGVMFENFSRVKISQIYN